MEEIIKISDDQIYAVKLDQINPVTLKNYKGLYFFSDEIMTGKETEQITGKLYKIKDRPFFKPDCTDELILLASETIVRYIDADISYHANFEARYNELKITDTDFCWRILNHEDKYPKDYAISEEMTNLVLNHPLYINIKALRKVETLQDDGIWEIILNEHLKDDYEKVIFKRKIMAQKELLESYLTAYDLDIEETKEKRKELIKTFYNRK